MELVIYTVLSVFLLYNFDIKHVFHGIAYINDSLEML